METLYRKVQSSERNPTIEGIYNTSKGLLAFSKTFGWVTIQNYTTPNPEYWLEEIHDNSQQIEKLEAEKKELLEALEGLYNSIERLPDIEYVIYGKQIESLIQKHKQ